tara:strand:+ start:754 stop:1365 length:612 start_codon:yes stop_codon:yes gene_type:complete
MWEKEKFYRFILVKSLFFALNICIIYLFSIGISLADLQKNIINKFTATKTLSFNFIQKISDKEETGICFIKYPLLMKCNYQNLKQKTIISNGKTVAIIKKKYKKIYYYPINTTPLFFILKKENIINLIRKTQPNEIDGNLIEFVFIDKKENRVKILFDKNSLEFKGWITKDAYSNNVSFAIEDLKINNQIVDDFFKIPKEEDL